MDPNPTICESTSVKIVKWLKKIVKWLKKPFQRKKRGPTILLDSNAQDLILHLQNEGGHESMSDTIRCAIGLYDWARAQHEQGYDFGAIRAGEPVKLVALPFRDPPNDA